MIKMNTLTGGNSASSHLPHLLKNKKSKSEINFAKNSILNLKLKNIYFFRTPEKNHILKTLLNYSNS